MGWNRHKENLGAALAEFAALDLRRSYFYSAGLIVCGFIVNLFLPHGWTVWPVVMVVAALLMIDEAADRNGTGVPPLRVYALALSAMAFWLLSALALSAINPFILVGGVAIVAYFGCSGFLRQREIDREFLRRRNNGLCLHCGERFDPRQTFCENCGQEPNPEAARRERVSTISRTPQSIERSKEALAQQARNADVRAKEQALLARRPGRITRGRPGRH